MRKQLFLALLLMMTLSLVSAGDLTKINNVKLYDNVTKTATIKESALGAAIVNATLNTPTFFEVGYGAEQKVAEFTLVNLYGQNYTDILDGMRIINLNTNREESKLIKYKYKTLGIEFINETVKSDCKYDNKTNITTCKESYKITNRTFDVWEPLTSFDILDGQSITIGLFTYVNKGDKYEWIPSIAGKEIPEWSVWSASLNTSLISYWQFDNGAGTNATDSVGANHLTGYGTPTWITSGIKNNATNLTRASSMYWERATGSLLPAYGQAFSINVWIKPTTRAYYGQDQFIVSKAGDSTDNYGRYHLVGYQGKLEYAAHDSTNAQVTVLSTHNYSVGVWQMVTIKYDGGTNMSLWVNGVYNNSNSISSFKNTGEGPLRVGSQSRNAAGNYFDGIIDELAFWNRSLSETEIQNLWNSGSGIFLSDGSGPPTVFLLTPTNNTVVTIPEQTFTCNATVSDGLKNASLIFDGNSVATNTTAINDTNYSFSYTIPSIGQHNWTCLVFSNSNQSTQPAINFITYGFAMTITSPTNTSYATTSIPLNVTSNNTLQNINYSLNGATNISFTPNITITGNYGLNNITVHAQSNYSINTSKYVAFFINGTQIQLNNPQNSQSYNLDQSFLYNANATSYGSTIKNVSLWTNTGGWNRKNTTTLTKEWALINTTQYQSSSANYELKQVIPVNNFLQNITFSIRDTGSIEVSYGIIGYSLINGSVFNTSAQTTSSLTFVNKTVSSWVTTEEIKDIYVYQKSDGSGAEIQGIWGYGYVDSTINKSWNYSYSSAQTIIWNVEVCDNNNICSLATNNRTVTINPADITLNSITYNATGLVGNNESIIANITANASLTTVVLYYDGFTYNMTNSSGIWSATINLNNSHVGTNNFYLNYTYSGLYTVSGTYQQTISQVTWTLCNATYPTQFLNITFMDESNGTILAGSITYSNWSYYLSGSTSTRLYEYTNTTTNLKYSFCGYPTDQNLLVTPYVQYSATDYPQRIWNPTQQTYNNTTTVQVLYLLSTSNGQYVTFQLTNNAEQTLEGVYVNATRSISGIDTVVGSGYTSSAGVITLWLNPDFSHTFCFSKTGYDTYCTAFAPTLTEYTVTLTGGTTTIDDYTRGIKNYFSPKLSTTLNNDTTYTFWYNLTSSYWEIDSFGFNLRLANGTVISGGTSTAEGTAATKNYNVNNQSIIYMDYYWVINGNYTYGKNYWVITNTEYTGWSIKTFFTDINTYFDSGFFGLDEFGRYLIVFIVLFFTIGIMSYKYSLTSPLAISITTFLVIFFFDVVTGIMPTIRGITNLPTYLAGIILALIVIKEAMEG